MMDTVRGRLGLVTDKFQQEQVQRLKAQAQQALNDIAQQQAAQHQVEQYSSMPGYDEGKTGIVLSENKEDIGPWSNIIPNAIGGLASGYQYLNALRQDIKTPNVYVSNPYASTALQNLANIRISPYANMREMYDVERRNAYGLKNAGGLTAGQKYAAAVGAGIGTQGNIGRALREIEAQNNQYKTAYNQALLQAGESAAQRMQTANQFNEEMTAKAHAAKVQNTQMGLRNFMDYLTQYAASEQKRKQYNKMLGMYEQSLVLDRDKLNQEIKYNNWQMDQAAKEQNQKEEKEPLNAAKIIRQVGNSIADIARPIPSSLPSIISKIKQYYQATTQNKKVVPKRKRR